MMALPMRWLARIAAALVWLLDSTSGLFFRLLGMSRDATAHVTAEELHLIVAEASRSGVLEEFERWTIPGVVRLADRSEAGRVGQEWGSSCRYGWSQYK